MECFLLAKVLKTTPQELIAQVAARNPEEDKNGELVKKKRRVNGQ
jgi:hypothetical protein